MRFATSAGPGRDAFSTPHAPGEDRGAIYEPALRHAGAPASREACPGLQAGTRCAGTAPVSAYSIPAGLIVEGSARRHPSPHGASPLSDKFEDLVQRRSLPKSAASNEGPQAPAQAAASSTGLPGPVCLAASAGPGRGALAAPPAGEGPARSAADRPSDASDAPEQRRRRLHGPGHGALEQPIGRLGAAPLERPQAPTFPAATDVLGGDALRRDPGISSGGFAGGAAPPAVPSPSS